MKNSLYGGEADCAIVTGAGLDRSDPTLPSPAGQLSVERAAGLYHEERVRSLIFTGRGALGNERNTESAAMQNYAVRNFDVNPEAVHIETESNSTLQNLFFGVAVARTFLLGDTGIVVTRETQSPRVSRLGGVVAEITGFGINAVVSPPESNLGHVHRQLTRAREGYQMRLTNRLLQEYHKDMTPEEVNTLYQMILDDSFGSRAKKAYHIGRRLVGLEQF